MLAQIYQPQILNEPVFITRKNIENEEKFLVERARQGDKAAFEQIYEKYKNTVFTLIYRLLGNMEDAYDVSQEVFTKAFKALPKTDSELNLAGWLHRIASNASMDVLRHRKKLQWLSWDSNFQTLSNANRYDEPEEHAMEEQTKKQVQNTLNKMHYQYRMCLVLREYMELSYEEIAEVMGVTPGAVKSLLFRAREQFRRMYKAECA